MKRFYPNTEQKARVVTFLAATLSLLLSALPASAVSSPLQSIKVRLHDESTSLIESALTARTLLNSDEISRGKVGTDTHINQPTLAMSVALPSSSHRSRSFKQPLLDQQLPLGLPLEGSHVNSIFGLRVHPIKQLFSQHKGIDFSAPRGTPVLSTADGVVAKADASGNSSYGKYIVIKHHFGYSTVYAHLDAVEVRAGNKVKAQEVIGLSGNTGRSSGPHLHYEIRYLDEPIDPKRFLDKATTTREGFSDKEKNMPWAEKSS